MNTGFGTPVFGSNTGNPFASTNGSNPFGAPVFGSSSGNASGGPQVQAQSSAFGQPFFNNANTQQKSNDKPLIGTEQASFGNFNQQQQNPLTQTSTSAFGQPAFNNNTQQQTSNTDSKASQFGQPFFGSGNQQQNATSHQGSSPFGQQAFAQPAFGQSNFGKNNAISNVQSSFGQTKSINNSPMLSNNAFSSSFGANLNDGKPSAFTQTLNASPFAQGSNKSSPFGTTTTDNKALPFGTTVGNKASPFGVPLGTDNKASPFGTTVTDNKASPFGSTTTDNKASPFGAPLGTDNKASPFGTTVTDNKASPFGSTTTDNKASPFGAPLGKDNKASPFASTTTDNKVSAFGTTAASNKASPFGKPLGADKKGSPFAQDSNKPSLFGTTETDKKVSSLSSSETDKKDVTGLNSLNKPSIFGSTSATTEKKSTLFSSPNSNTSLDGKKSNQTSVSDKFEVSNIFGNKQLTVGKEEKSFNAENLNTNNSKPLAGLFGKKHETEQKSMVPASDINKSVDLEFGSMSINKETTTPKKTATSPVKAASLASRGLSGATPTKKASQKLFDMPTHEDLKNEEIAAKLKLTKPAQPVKPNLDLNVMENLKNPKTLMTVVPPAVEDVFRNKDFKAINSATNQSIFANTVLGNLQYIVDEYSTVLLTEKIQQFHSNSNVILSYSHYNGSNLIVKDGEALKISVVNKELALQATKFDSFTQNLIEWDVAFNGDDLAIFYNKTLSGKLFVLDVSKGSIISIDPEIGCGIKKLKWHPLANNAVVVFMTLNDHKLYQLDVWTSRLLLINEQIVGMFKATESIDKLSSILSNLRVAESFKFKNINNFEISPNGWKLYLLDTVLNEVYIINPFLPFTGSIHATEDHLLKLKEIHELLSEEKIISKEIIEKGLSFLNDKTWLYRKSDNMFYLDPSLDLRLNMGLQGPISFNKYPDTLYGKNMKDLKIISSSDSELELIVVLFDTGDIATFIDSGKEVLFWNQWDVTVFDNKNVNKFILLEDNFNELNISNFTNGDLEDGLIVRTNTGGKSVLSFIDHICKLEGFFISGNSGVLKDKFEIINVLSLSSSNDYTIAINEKLVGKVTPGLLEVLPYPTFRFISSTKFLTQVNQNIAITNLHSKKDIPEKTVITLQSLSHDSLNFYKDQLLSVSKTIKELRLLPEVNNSVTATELQNLLHNFPDETMPIASELSIAIEKKLSSMKLLQELLLKTINTQEQDFQLRISQIADLKPKFYALRDKIKPNSERYDNLIENWGKKLLKLQTIKSKLDILEKETIESEKNNNMSPEYYKQLDIQIQKVKEMLDAFAKAKETQQFLAHKLDKTFIEYEKSGTCNNVAEENDLNTFTTTKDDKLSAIFH